MMGKTIFVTGGGGFVGSHCVYSLLESGYDVVAIDNFANCIKGGSSSLPECLSRVEKMTGKKIVFYKADLMDVESLKVPFRNHKIDAVIHFAALKAVGESCREPLMYYENNVLGICNLIKVMEEFGVRKFVFSSSSTVYGDPQYLPVDEKHPTGNCTNPYGKTKYICELILKDIQRANQSWQIMLLRYFNPVGSHPSGLIGEEPRGVPNNLMPYITQVALGKLKKLTVFGNDYDTVDGTGVRDYIHVMDLAEGHVAALRAMFSPDFQGVKAYNLGSGKGVSVLEMVKAFEAASGRKIPLEFAPRRSGDVATTFASAELAKKELGYQTKLDINDMCKDSWNWQTKNPNGYSGAPASHSSSL